MVGKAVKPLPEVLYAIQEGWCFHCSMWMAPERASLEPGGTRNGWTREHLLAQGLGGKTYRNVVLACLDCNSRRGMKRPTVEETVKAMLIWDRAEAEWGYGPWHFVDEGKAQVNNPPYASVQEKRRAKKARRALRRQAKLLRRQENMERRWMEECVDGDHQRLPDNGDGRVGGSPDAGHVVEIPAVSGDGGDRRS